jgi:hypothetical protein
MESSERGALGLVRLVGGCIIIVGLLDAGLYFTQYFMQFSGPRHHSPAPPLHVFRLILDLVPVVLGIVILVKAKALAEWLSKLIQ